MALTTTQNNPVSGLARRTTGYRSGTRTAADFTITLGYAPTYIRVINMTDRDQGEWFADATAATQLLTVAEGARSYADCGITVSGKTFTVDVSTVDLETDNDETYWEAIG